MNLYFKLQSLLIGIEEQNEMMNLIDRLNELRKLYVDYDRYDLVMEIDRQILMARQRITNIAIECLQEPYIPFL
ncbi:hypothetical protein F4X73_05880 [Candidatus Poribacteria bacterium]|nr:hypothetical protein [Candidatus Poribacteria bacterium]